MAVFGFQVALAIALSLVDSYRRRGKKPKPFPVTAAAHRRGRRRDADDVHLRHGPLRRHAGRDRRGQEADPLRDLHLEGRRHRRAVQDRADPGRRSAASRSTASTTASRTPSSRRGSCVPARVKVLRYPIWSAGWRFWDLRRYGRDHRKILVVDEEVGFVGGYNIGSPYATEWRDTHVRITGPGVWDLQADLRRLLEPQPPQAHRSQRAAAAARDGVRVGAADPLRAQRARGCGCSRSGRCTSRRSIAPPTTSG